MLDPLKTDKISWSRNNIISVLFQEKTINTILHSGKTRIILPSLRIEFHCFDSKQLLQVLAFDDIYLQSYHLLLFTIRLRCYLLHILKVKQE